jgi:hypothetical protein
MRRKIHFGEHADTVANIALLMSAQHVIDADLAAEITPQIWGRLDQEAQRYVACNVTFADLNEDMKEIIDLQLSVLSDSALDYYTV